MLRELLAYFKINVGTASLAKADAQLNATKASTAGLFAQLGSLRNAFLAFAAGGAASFLGSMADDTLEVASSMATLADRTDLSFEEFQKWEALAGSAGISAKDLAEGFVDFADRIEDFAARGQGEGADAFKKLGIELKDTEGNLRSSADVFTDFAIGLSEMGDQTEATGLAVRALGDNAFRILPALKGNREEILANLKRAEELGVVFDKAFAKKASAVKTELFFLQRQLFGLRVLILRAVLPGLQQTVKSMTLAIKATREWAKEHRVRLMKAFRSGAVTAFLALIAKVVKSFGGIRGAIRILMPWVNRLFFSFMRFAIPFLIIDDLLAFLEGRKSIIGVILEEFGLVDDAQKSGSKFTETIKSWVPELRKASRATGQFFKESAIGFGALVGMWSAGNNDMADDFEGVFLRNTGTIDKFFDWLFVKTLDLPNIWQASADLVHHVFVGLFANVVSLIGTSIKAVLALWIGMGVSMTSVIGGQLARVAALFDSVFGTQLSVTVASAQATIIAGFQGAWDGATAGIDAIVDRVKFASDIVREILLDPIAGVANALAGTTRTQIRADVAETNERARQRAREITEIQPLITEIRPLPEARSVTINDQRTTTVQVTAPPAQQGATGRAVAGAVASTQTADRRRTLAAVQ